MFKGGFEEASTNIAKFPDDPVESMDLMLGWVYQGHLRQLTVKRVIREENTNQSVMSWDPVQLYVLSEKLCIPELMDRTIDAYRQYAKERHSTPGPALIRDTYRRTITGSPLRKYVAACFAYQTIHGTEKVWGIESMSKFMTEVPDLGVDVMRLLRDSRGEVDNPRDISACEFHTHADIPCPWKKVEDGK
jgi:hypothetical protein